MSSALQRLQAAFGTAWHVNATGALQQILDEIAGAVGGGTGDSWFVNELAANANDNNSGDVADPFLTLDAAQAAAKANNGDVVLLMGTSHRTTPLNWAKNGVSLVGLLAGSNNNRSRISVLPVSSGLTQTQVTALHPLVNVTGQGCSFLNIEGFHGFDGSLTPPAASVCWAEAAGRNYYDNCQFFGGGDALTAALAGMRSLTIGGSGENLFDGCTIGLDTIVRASNPNASLELIGGTARNKFRWSSFESYCSDASDVHILIQSGGMDRYLMLQSCILHNFGGTALSAAITNAGGSPAGDVILDPNCISVGATAIATSGNVYGPIGALGATTWGIGGLLT